MSKRSKGVVTLAVSLSVVWLAFILYGSPWVGLMWVVSLAFAAALWMSRRAPEPVPAIASPMRAATPAPKAVL